MPWNCTHCGHPNSDTPPESESLLQPGQFKRPTPDQLRCEACGKCPGPPEVMRPGLAISQKGFGAAMGGSLGCIVLDRKTRAPMVLGNYHVLQFYAEKGMLHRPTDFETDLVCPDGATIVGSYPTGPEELAEIAALYVVARFARGEKKLDAAVAALAPGVRWANRLPGGEPLFLAPPGPVPSGTGVHKVGARSGPRSGTVVDAPKKSEKVTYKTFHLRTLPMPVPMRESSSTYTLSYRAGHYIRVAPREGEEWFQQQGDSGSVLYNGYHQIVGLLSSGGRDFAIAIPIHVVLDALDVDFPDEPEG